MLMMVQKILKVVLAPVLPVQVVVLVEQQHVQLLIDVLKQQELLFIGLTSTNTSTSTSTITYHHPYRYQAASAESESESAPTTLIEMMIRSFNIEESNYNPTTTSIRRTTTNSTPQTQTSAISSQQQHQEKQQQQTRWKRIVRRVINYQQLVEQGPATAIAKTTYFLDWYQQYSNNSCYSRGESW
jgi:hypothetical protein